MYALYRKNSELIYYESDVFTYVSIGSRNLCFFSEFLSSQELPLGILDC